MTMKDISYRVALGGIVSALCLVTMFLAGVIPALYIVLPMIAGFLMMIISIEVNTAWAFLTYISVSLLSLFVTFDKEAALIFIMFFGHYPILRFYISKIKFKPLKAVIKSAVFNVCILAYVYVTVYVMGLQQLLEELDGFGKYGAVIMLVIVNLIFLLYDYNLEICHIYYRARIMPKFRRKK